MACTTCELVSRRDEGEAPEWDSILRTALFDVVHAFNTSLPGWLVIVARRHLESIDELTDNESSELGQLISRCSRHLKTVTGCEKTYVMQFAEAPGHQHVHFHVVPRMADLPAAHRGAGIFHYLGVDDNARVSEVAMNQFAAQFRACDNEIN